MALTCAATGRAGKEGRDAGGMRTAALGGDGGGKSKEGNRRSYGALKIEDRKFKKLCWLRAK